MNVLFICVGFFNARAPLGWKADSAGTNPSKEVSKEAVGVMKEGCGVESSRLELSTEPIEMIDWNLGKGLTAFCNTRDETERSVERLISESWHIKIERVY